MMDFVNWSNFLVILLIYFCFIFLWTKAYEWPAKDISFICLKLLVFLYYKSIPDTIDYIGFSPIRKETVVARWKEFPPQKSWQLFWKLLWSGKELFQKNLPIQSTDSPPEGDLPIKSNFQTIGSKKVAFFLTRAVPTELQNCGSSSLFVCLFAFPYSSNIAGSRDNHWVGGETK